MQIIFDLGSEQQRRLSDCADTLTDMRLCCPHMEKAKFSHSVAHTMSMLLKQITHKFMRSLGNIWATFIFRILYF